MRFKFLVWLSFVLAFARTGIASLPETGPSEDRAAVLAEQLEVADDQDRPRLLNELAKLVWRTQPERAVELSRESLSLATRHDDLQAMADAHRSMGLGRLALSEYAESLTEMQEAEGLYRRLGNDIETAKALGYQGMALSSMGRLWPAIEVVRQALEIFRAVDFQTGIAASTNNLGVYYERVGEYELALSSNLKALQIERELDRTIGIANNLNSIGNIHAKMENHEQAREYYQQALELFEQIGANDGVVHCLNNLGNCCEKLDQDDEALQYFHRALEQARGLGDASLEANPLTNIGIVHKKRQEYEQALANYRRSAEIREQLGEVAELASAHHNMGEVYLLMGRLPEALDHLHQAETIAIETGSQVVLEGVYLNLAEAHHRLGDDARAYGSLQRYTEVREAHLGEEKSRVVAELQARYDADRRREELELLTRDNKIQKLQLSRAKLTTYLMMTVAALVIGAAVVLLRRYRSLLAFWKKKVFIGPYRVGNEISSGGMGIVYRATNVLDPGKTVALKVIREEFAGNEIQRKRFINEGQIIDSINHPNIVTVFDRGEHNQRLYIAMEYLNGRTLAEILNDTADRGSDITLPRCLTLMGQLADAVTSIHAIGIVHRDIKPNNCIVIGDECQGETAKLLDFGAAKLDTMTTLTEAGELIGTVSYLAPERVRHQAPTPASDIFSLGVVFYEILTLEKPFPAEDPALLLRQLLFTDPVTPASFRPDLVSDISELVINMLHKEPTRRPDNEELLHRLTRCAAAVT